MPRGQGPTHTDRLLTKEQAAEILGMKPAAVAKCIERRQLPYVKMGRRVRIRESVLMAFIAALPSFGPDVPHDGSLEHRVDDSEMHQHDDETPDARGAKRSSPKETPRHDR